MAAPLTVLHLAPHPDDEALGAPATLLRLRDAAPREPDPTMPLAPVPSDRPLGWWLDEPSFHARLAAAQDFE